VEPQVIVPRSGRTGPKGGSSSKAASVTMPTRAKVIYELRVSIDPAGRCKGAALGQVRPDEARGSRHARLRYVSVAGDRDRSMAKQIGPSAPVAQDSGRDNSSSHPLPGARPCRRRSHGGPEAHSRSASSSTPMGTGSSIRPVMRRISAHRRGGSNECPAGPNSK